MNAIRLQRIAAARTQADAEALRQVFAGAPAYVGRAIGRSPTLDEMRSVELPPGITEGDHFLFGIFLDAEMIGCADLLRGYPDEKRATLGLLLLKERFQRRSLGSQSYRAIEAFVRSWPEVSVIHGAIVATNAIVLPFWRKIGFVDTGVRQPYRSGDVTSETIIMEKPVARHTDETVSIARAKSDI